jgi:hypothetical protein
LHGGGTAHAERDAGWPAPDFEHLDDSLLADTIQRHQASLPLSRAAATSSAGVELLPVQRHWRFGNRGWRSVAFGWSWHALALAWLLLNGLLRLPDPWWLIGIASIAAIVPVPRTAQQVNDQYSPAVAETTLLLE